MTVFKKILEKNLLQVTYFLNFTKEPQCINEPHLSTLSWCLEPDKLLQIYIYRSFAKGGGRFKLQICAQKYTLWSSASDLKWQTSSITILKSS